jgi:mannose-6-phosphate isomerase-like protein (cupin superfamily)
MLGWVDDIEKITVENDQFRKVVFTGKEAQLVLMSLAPGEDIGWEAHDHIDQFIRLEQGKARVDFGVTEDAVDESHQVEADWAFIVPTGTWHNVTNTGDEAVRLYTIYSPPEHPDGVVYATKAQAMAAEEHR